MDIESRQQKDRSSSSEDESSTDNELDSSQGDDQKYQQEGTDGAQNHQEEMVKLQYFIYL